VEHENKQEGSRKFDPFACLQNSFGSEWYLSDILEYIRYFFVNLCNFFLWPVVVVI